jgi:hypothetical protein
VSTYYVKDAAHGGNDGNSGLSDLLAWATISHVNAHTFSAGDSCLFKRGSLWRETLTPGQSGSAGNVITFGAYDSGANPIISAANLVTSWTLYSGNVWQATVTMVSWDKDLFINKNHGDLKTSTGAIVNEFDWYYTGTTLYLYATSDPNTLYTAPGVEVRTRANPVGCSKDYIVFDGLTIEMGNLQGFNATAGNYWEVKNCSVRYNGEGFSFHPSTSVTGWSVHDNAIYMNHESGIYGQFNLTACSFYRNEVYQNGRVVMLSGDQYDSGIKFWDVHDTPALTGLEFYENYIHDNNVGFWLDGVQPPGDPILFHHNWVQDCTTQALMLELSSHCHAWGNVMWRCGTTPTGENEAWCAAGINISGRDDPSGVAWSCHDNLIYNNTIYGSNIGINLWQNAYGYTTSSLVNNLIKNNIVFGSITRPLSCGNGGDNDNATWHSSGNTFWYNCFGPQSSNFIRWGGTYYSTYAAWEAATGVILDGGTTHSINADPLLTNPGGGVFTLQAGSPCIDVGANLGSTYQDGLLAASAWPSGVVTGAQGSYGAGWEVGAYIYQPPTAWMIAHLAAGGS